MHPSYFEIMNCSQDDEVFGLQLSAEASEWLFFIKFWDTINTMTGEIFGQYEDDVLSVDKIPIVIEQIHKVRSIYLVDMNATQVGFYGWDASGERLNFSIRGFDLELCIQGLKSFLERAISLNSDVFCQL